MVVKPRFAYDALCVVSLVDIIEVCIVLMLLLHCSLVNMRFHV